MRRLGRFLAAAAIAVGALVAVSGATLTVGAPPASATGGSGCTGYNLGGQGWAVECGNGGSSGGGTSGGGGTSVCTYITLAEAVQQFLVSQAVAAQYQAPPGYIYLVQNCPDQFFGVPAIVLYADGGKLTPKDLANQAYKQLSPPALTIGTAPPSGKDGLVGLPEWFWIAAADYLTLSKTVSLAGLSATVTAKPGPLVINPGDGRAFTCPGPGTPYNTSKPASSQQSECTFLYTQPSAGQPNNEFTVSISVTWTATWTGTGGVGGTLAPITRTATVELPIAQAETVYAGGGG